MEQDGGYSDEVGVSVEIGHIIVTTSAVHGSVFIASHSTFCPVHLFIS